MHKDSISPSVSLELGGQQRQLVFDFNAQAAFEKVTGIAVGDLFDRRGKLKIASRFTRALLWSQLLHFDKRVQFDEFGEIVAPPELSMQQVGALITRANLNEVTRKTAEALIAFYREPKADEGNEGGEENPQSR